MPGKKKPQKPNDLSLNALLQGNTLPEEGTNKIHEPVLYPPVEIRKGKDIMKSDYDMIAHHLESLTRIQESVFHIKKRKYDFDIRKLHEYQSYFPEELTTSGKKKKTRKVNIDDPNFESLEKDEKENKDDDQKPKEKPKEKKEGDEDDDEEEEVEKKDEKDNDDYTTGYFNEDDEEFGEPEETGRGEDEEPVF